MRRVVVTGQGTINALGHNVPDTLAALRAGHSGIGPLDIPDVDRLLIRIGAQVRGFDPATHFDRQQLALYDRFTQFALIAADQAVTQSGLRFKGGMGDRSGVTLGTAAGGIHTWEDAYRAVFETGKNRVHPFVVPKLMLNAAAAHMSMRYGLRGPAFAVSTACASSNHAMGQAFQLIRAGGVDVVLTGGSEAMLCFGGIKAWEGLRVMSPDGCRPFSKDRNGMVLGEGAAVFVFENRDHALARGAEILAEVAGFAMNSDASDIVMPSREGAARAIAGALSDAGLLPGEVGYINAHGTGTTANDTTECAAISEVFGSRCPLVSSTKSMHGHLIGGTGAVELLAVIMALREGVIAPTAGFGKSDPDCPLDVVPNEAREAPINAALSNAFAFGGLNAVLALRKAS